jgi:hypothetical protein
MDAFLSGVFEINLGYQRARGFYVRPNLKNLFQSILDLFTIDALQFIFNWNYSILYNQKSKHNFYYCIIFYNKLPHAYKN